MNKRKRSGRIIVKFTLYYLTAALSMFVLLNTIGVRMLEKSILENKKKLLVEEAGRIAYEYGEKYFSDSSVTIFSIGKQLESVDAFLDVRIWFLNKSGKIIFDTRSKDTNGICITDYHKDIMERQFVENIVYDGLINEPVLTVVEPVFYDYALKGYICLNATMSDLLAEAVYYTDFINICFLFFLVILLLVFAFIFYTTARPVFRIREAAQEYAKGNYAYVIKEYPFDEYSEMAEAINLMAAELRGLEDYRKNFIANVSHDFRSPLTSIRGYAEAMKDGTIPYEMQEKYFDIILFETERLTKLTSDLLVLNSIDNNGMRLEQSVFDVNAVIKATAATFEGICTKKKVTIELEFFAENVYVKADIGRIEQVLTNLLDNAIKFSHNDSSVIVRVSEKHSKILISVKDFGIGIPKEAINRIYERFYKSDISRGKDKKGTGLGLAITKEIINAHGEEITVVSTVDVGTEFVFSLAKAEEQEAL